MGPFIPYCGSPPTPASLQWNHAPVLTALLLLAPVARLSLVKAASGPNLSFLAGWLVAGLCFLSPLCNLSVALFAARSTEHVVLVLVAAPLLAAGLGGKKARGHSLSVMVSATAFAGLVWIWHSPRFYDLTLQNNVAFWAMNVSMIGSAVWFWRTTFSADGLAALAGVSFVGLEMTLLGALIAFAHRPFYSVHALTTIPWGLSQMDDQRLGGLIMWVPAGLLGLSYSAVALAQWFADIERRRPFYEPIGINPEE